MSKPGQPELSIRLNGRVVELPDPEPIVIGRDAQSGVCLTDERASRRHAALRLEGRSWIVEDLGSLNGMFLEGRRVERVVVDRPVALRFGNAGSGDLLELSPTPLPPTDRSDHAPTQTAVGALTSVRRITRPLRIGRADDNDIVLSDPIVSRHHAEFLVDGTGYQILDQSFNGTFVNGTRIAGTAPLAEDDLVGIGRHTFRVLKGRIEEYVDTGEVPFDAIGLSRRTRSGVVLLDDVGFALAPRSFLAILGPTGAGKSTLMSALAGFRPADRGVVLYGGMDLYANYEQLRFRIGYVPQDDILHQQLKLRVALEYAGELRFPADADPADRRRRVAEVMEELGLADRADLVIQKLSGGQRKRTSVAVELLTKPSILFLDEPTSGLDPGYERAVMSLLGKLAREGRTVVAVTHSLQSIELCDRALFLAPGGKLAYFGPPAEVLPYFGRASFADVFADLEHRQDTDWAKRYQQDPLFAKYRKVSLPGKPDAPTYRIATSPGPRRDLVRQLSTLTRRYLHVLAADRRNLAVLTAQAPILGLLMLAVFASDALSAIPNKHARALLLTLMLSATWLGASNAVREIVKERAIYLRERAIGLVPWVYVLSKVIVLAVLTIAQAILLANLALAGQDSGAQPSGPGNLVFDTAVAAIGGMALGLLVSAVASTPDRALSLLPIVLIAQLILANPLFELNRPPLRELGYLASAKWAFSAGAATVDLHAVETATCEISPPQARDNCRVWTDGPESWGASVAALGLLTTAGVVGTWLVLRRSRIT